jgi:hypothetical protein
LKNQVPVVHGVKTYVGLVALGMEEYVPERVVLFNHW